MHHLAYKLIRKPSNANRKRAQRNNELSRPTSPLYSEQELRDREEITRLKIENEKLKDSLECRENEVGTLKEEVQRMEDTLRTASRNAENDDNFSAEGDETEINGPENSLPYSGALCQRNQPSHEVKIVREALCSLRQCFPGTDPHQHTIDTVEQSLTSLAERLVDAQKRTEGHVNSSVFRQNSFSMDTGSEFHGSYVSSSFGLPVSPVFMNHSFSTKANTKLVYYTAKSSTPFVSVIHKRLGEITLKDLKSSLDRPGQYRYHFKTLDPDYGMVKEEVVHDDDIVPGWDDRIVAWIEKVDD